jgi:transcriptional regulator with XRE-family HTH domain
LASGLWRGDDDERTWALLDLQGRKTRQRMEELGLTIGELARGIEIDTVTLVAILFGQREIGVIELLDLSGALNVPPDWMVDGTPVRPQRGSRGGGIYEIDRDQDADADPAESPSDDERVMPDEAARSR